MCIRNGCIHLSFAYCRIGSSSIGNAFNFFTACINTICFINGNTTNCYFIEGYVFRSTNSNITTCIGNGNIITINEIYRIATSYFCCRTCISCHLPGTTSFNSIFHLLFIYRRCRCCTSCYIFKFCVSCINTSTFKLNSMCTISSSDAIRCYRCSILAICGR